MKYKQDHNKNPEQQKIDLLEGIANEIAEANRLTRISLTNNFIQAAASQLYKQGKDEKGQPIILAPSDEDKAAYEKQVGAIEFTLGDHMGKIDEDKIKEEAEPPKVTEGEPEKKEGGQTEN